MHLNIYMRSPSKYNTDTEQCRPKKGHVLAALAKSVIYIYIPLFKKWGHIVQSFNAVMCLMCRQTETVQLLMKEQSGPEVIKLFSCSTQLSMKFSPLINVKMPTIVGILTCISGKNNILGLTEP